MERKQPSHHRAARGIAGCPLQDPEKQQHIQHMQNKVCVMVSGRVEPVKLAIRGVRKPSQRMPVALIKCGECPLDSLPVQAGDDVNVPAYVKVVIKVDE